MWKFTNIGADWRGPTALAILVVCLALALACAIIGIDFGTHWDEDRLTYALTTSVRSGVLLPGWYNYPSLPYDLLLGLAIPDIASHVPGITQQLARAEEVPGALAAAAETFGQPEFLLRARVFFAIITLGTAVWAFLIVRALGRPILEAALAAAIFLSTWELGYHARWVAPDGIMMHFATLSLLLMIVAARSQKRNLMWLHGAAIALGLAVGSKYPAGIMLLPLAYAAFSIVKARNPEARLWPLLGKTAVVLVSCGAVLSLAFVFTTPAALIAPWTFVRDVHWEIWHYGRADHHGNTVSPGLEHGALILGYLGLELFSPWALLALVIAAFAIAGAVDLIRKDRNVAIYLLLVTVIYVLYFSTQKVMFVRNLMLVFPVLAILAARGISWALQAVPRANLRYAAAGVVTLAVAANFGWQLSAAVTIAGHPEQHLGTDTKAYLLAHSGEKFLLSDSVRTSLGPDIPQNVVTSAADAKWLIITSTDETDFDTWNHGNHPGTYTIVAGGASVNWDYYPAWLGRKFHIMVSIPQARSMGLSEAGAG